MARFQQTRFRMACSVLADAFLAGTWHVRSLMARGDHALGDGGLWLRALAFDVVQRWPEAPVDDHEGLLRFIGEHGTFRRAWRRRGPIREGPWKRMWGPVAMAPSRWPVPKLDAVGDVASWLGLTSTELAWFADGRGLERLAASEALRHYRRRWVDRGPRLPRLIEAPKERLKAMQRRILDEVLAHVPVYDAAHGFVEGRSVLTHARLHVGQRWVVRFDLEAFFTNVQTFRAMGVFRALGYRSPVAATLLGLCTTRTPESVLRLAPSPDGLSTERFFLQRKLADWHLPQGAPTSPVLANLTCHRLDARLRGLGRAHGWTYSRYADDLVFSSNREGGVGQLCRLVRRVVEEEGFRVNASKTRVMRAHERQVVTGVVVNQRLNVPRAEFDSLKALLHRCFRKGPLSQSRTSLEAFKAELEGRVAWVAAVSPARGAKLWRDFERIVW
jgi:RNA-directed DNA polymerase